MRRKLPEYAQSGNSGETQEDLGLSGGCREAPAMPLSQPDALRILRFCLAADDSGSAAVLPDGDCRITIVLCQSSYEVHTFDGTTFEESLRRAGSAGVLKSACVDKQIAFVSRREVDRGPPDARFPILGPPPAPSAHAPLEGDDGASPFLTLASGIHGLVHETQRERGVSTLFAASGGRLFADELAAQWRRTDQQRAALAELLRRTEDAPPPSVLHRLDRAGALMAHIAPVRAGLEDLVISAPRVIAEYSAVNAELLGALDAFMVTGVGGNERAGALACVALLYAKEKTGIERAQLTDAFFEDRFSEGQRLSVAALIAAQSSYLHIFSSAAPRAAEQLLRRTLASPAAAEVQRMESVVFGPGDVGFGIDPSLWFTTISRKIDMLGDVSSSVITMLREQH
jgi:hypothetical protein